MQKLALILLLVITASMIFTFGTPAIAQESGGSSGGEMTDEEMTDDTMADEEMMDDTMMEEVMETVASPLKQMAAGVDPHEIQCSVGQKLVFKSSNWRPSCINESSYDVLAARGWVSSHDPTHEDLAKMVDDYMVAHPQEETEVPEETQDSVEIEEDVVVEEEEIPGNGTETETEGQTEPQSYSIELSESMDMGAQ
jgi:hypothetical protein